MARGPLIGIVVAGLVTPGCAGRRDPPAPTPAATGPYAAAQAARGAETFRRACGNCHGVAEFRGRDFAWRWRRQSAWDLFRRVSTTMPLNDPGGLPGQTYADVIAYLLALNGHPPGPTELVASEAALAAVPVTPGRGS